MKIKTKLSDYKTAPLEIEVDDESVTIQVRSMSSREFKDARSAYLVMIEHANANDIPLKEKAKASALGIDAESTTELPSEYYKKAMSVLLSSLVSEWPFESDIAQEIYDNPDFGNEIDRLATGLSEEFIDAKKP